jgi:hypothetical protein
MNMKRVSLFIMVVFVLGCKTNHKMNKSVVYADEKMIKLKKNQVNEKQEERAYSFGKRVLNTCNTSKFKTFSRAEATTSIIKNTTKEKLQKACTFFNQKYGSFVDLKLRQVLRDPENKNTMYRFKANYENKKANKELQVTMNDVNKLVALRSKDWTRRF